MQKMCFCLCFNAVLFIDYFSIDYKLQITMIWHDNCRNDTITGSGDKGVRGLVEKTLFVVCIFLFTVENSTAAGSVTLCNSTSTPMGQMQGNEIQFAVKWE